MKSNGKRAAAGACRRRHIRKTGTSNEGQQVLLPVCPVVRTLKSIVPKLKSKPRRRAKSVLRTSGGGGSSSSSTCIITTSTTTICKSSCCSSHTNNSSCHISRYSTNFVFSLTCHSHHHSVVSNPSRTYSAGGESVFSTFILSVCSSFFFCVSC